MSWGPLAEVYLHSTWKAPTVKPMHLTAATLSWHSSRCCCRLRMLGQFEPARAAHTGPQPSPWCTTAQTTVVGWNDTWDGSVQAVSIMKSTALNHQHRLLQPYILIV